MVRVNIKPGYAGAEPRHPDNSCSSFLFLQKHRECLSFFFSFLFHRNLNAIYLTKNNSTPQATQSSFKPAAPPVFSLFLFIDKRLPFLQLRFTQKYHREQPQPNQRMTWLFSLQRLKCFPYCGTPNGRRKCCHSAPLSKLPEWGFDSGGCQCGRSQSGTDPARVSSCWGIVEESWFSSLRCTLSLSSSQLVSE